MLKHVGGAFAALAVLATCLIGIQTATAPVADAATCSKNWTRDLKNGMTGSDVKELQIRLAAYNGTSGLVIDGIFGDRTEAAVKRFKKEYGFSNTTGVAGSAVRSKLNSLTSSDCTPIHFTYAELNKCNTSWDGGPLPPSQAKENARRLMWKLEALRHSLGDKPIGISSGFRSYSCNNAVNGSPTSRHLYGSAADVINLSHSFCTIAVRAKSYGYHGILGPGFPGHNDHVHLSDGDKRSAPSCSGF